jgi:hypothetical protein
MSEGLRDGEAVHVTGLGSGRLHVETVVVHHDCSWRRMRGRVKNRINVWVTNTARRVDVLNFGIPIGKVRPNGDCMLTCEKHASKTIAKITQSKYKSVYICMLPQEKRNPSRSSK